MSKKQLSIVLVVLLLGVISWVIPATAQETPPPIAVELFTGRAQFTDDVDMHIKVNPDGLPALAINLTDPSLIVTARLTIQPGARFPWHTHPGPVVVNVVEGDLVYVAAADCVERPYSSGTAFVDPGRGYVHTAYNPSATEETVLVATFHEVTATGPLTITAGVTPPAGCDL